MSIFNRITLLICILILSGCASAIDPREFALTPGENKSVLMIKVPRDTPNYAIFMAPFDTEKQAITSNTRNIVGFGIDSLGEPQYQARLIPAGTYVVREFLGQGRWSMCFQDTTYSIELKPDEIVYLGEIDAKFHMSELGKKVREAGETTTSSTSSRKYYFEGITAPKFDLTADVDELKQYIETDMPLLNAPIRVARLESAKFNYGYGLIGDKVCGGMFKGADRNKED